MKTKSILDITVSQFQNAFTPEHPTDVNLLQWLTTDIHAAIIARIRSSTNDAEIKKLKAALPAITPSGQFSYRSQEGLIKHTGLIQIDIDGKDNPDTDMQELKQELSDYANIAFLAFSASGKGLFGLVHIEDPNKHKEHFDAIIKALDKLGVILDPLPRNVASLRFATYDPEPYINHHPKPFKAFVKPAKKKRSTTIFNYQSSDKAFDSCLSQIQQRGMDITLGYEAWFKLSCALANEFQETGREYFHAISQFNSDYNPVKTDKQYDDCLKHDYPITIGTFFHICADYGIVPQKGHKNPFTI